MAKISRKKSIIKKRASTFHLKPKVQTRKEKIISTIAKPAEFIHKQLTSEGSKKAMSKIGSVLRGWVEASRSAVDRQYRTTRNLKKARR